MTPETSRAYKPLIDGSGAAGEPDGSSQRLPKRLENGSSGFGQNCYRVMMRKRIFIRRSFIATVIFDIVGS
ncbi:MAG: hypothetical protein CMP81_05565 [Fulvimarina sp.]|nr:hypothetical protein [Fulvimarina sp.]